MPTLKECQEVYGNWVKCIVLFALAIGGSYLAAWAGSQQRTLYTDVTIAWCSGVAVYGTAGAFWFGINAIVERKR